MWSGGVETVDEAGVGAVIERDAEYRHVRHGVHERRRQKPTDCQSAISARGAIDHRPPASAGSALGGSPVRARGNDRTDDGSASGA